MVENAIDIYCDAFVAPDRHQLDSAPVALVAPGVRGVAFIRLLISDDAGYERLVTEVAGAWRGVVFVFERASRCHELLRGRPGWAADATQMAMVLPDIQAMTGGALPDGLELRPVNLGASEEPDAIPLDDAAAVAIASDHSITGSAAEVAGFLGRLPASVRMFAAADEGGGAHATSACHVFGDYAQIFFVNTEPAWRRRGIGQAVTAGAVRSAAHLGARHVFLHATDDGAGVYARLGFEAVGMLTRYSYRG